MWNIIVTVFQIEFRKHLNTNVHVSSWIVFYILSKMFLTCSHTQQMSPKLHSKEMLTCHKIQKQKSLTSHMTCEGCDDNRSQKSQNVCLVDLRFWQSLQITNSGFLRVSQGLSGSLKVSHKVSHKVSQGIWKCGQTSKTRTVMFDSTKTHTESRDLILLLFV